MNALVLEGGGAKGAYQIGAVKALYEMGYEFNAITGTSIGAINGAFLTQDKFDEIYDIWYNARPSMIFEVNEEVLEDLFEFELKKDNLQRILNYLGSVINDHGLDITPLRNLLQEHIDEEKIRHGKKDYGLVSFCLTDMQPVEVFVEDIPQGQLIDYILASSAVPIFKMHKINEKVYVDGGFYDNLPINLIASKGYKEIVTIETNGVGRKRELKYDDLQITRISPEKKISKTFEVDTKVIRNNMTLGYLDAYKKMKPLKGRDYYIEVKHPDYFKSFFKNLDDEKKKKISNYFGYKDNVVDQKILPIIAELLDLEGQVDDQSILIRLNEYIGNLYNIDKKKIYTFEQFEDMVSEAFNFNEDLELSRRFNAIPLLKLITFNYELVTKNLKDGILKNFYRILYK